MRFIEWALNFPFHNLTHYEAENDLARLLLTCRIMVFKSLHVDKILTEGNPELARPKEIQDAGTALMLSYKECTVQFGLNTV